MSDSTSATVNPPMTAIAKGCKSSAPAPRAKARGSIPSMAASEVIKTGQTWFGKEKQTVSVIMPLKDRNGEPIAAVRVVMKSFKGQTEENAIVRAAPIVREIQQRVGSLEDLIF